MRTSLPSAPRSLQIAVIALALSAPMFMLVACKDDSTPPPPTPSTSDSSPLSGPGGRPLGQPDPGPGTHFRLSNADPVSAEDVAGVRSTAGTPIEGAELDALVARLPELPEAAADSADFRMPPGPPRPAIAGETIEVVFPPAEDAAAPPAGADGPLVVERVQPEGDVSIASHLAVTFSRPFAPLAANAALDALDVPASIEPEPAGRWRWVGTRTLLFEPELRFPMATEYSVDVPAGAEAADGTALAEGRNWTFRTPPPSVTTFWSTVLAPERSALIVLGFDQAIDPGAVVPFVSARVGREDIALRSATEAEIDADEGAAQMVAGLADNRRLALASDSGLPAGADVDIVVGPGVPSAEGPLTSEEAQEFSFGVYGTLQANFIRCNRSGEDRHDASVSGGRGRITSCDPFSEWSIDFNNPLDGDPLTDDMVTVEPEVPGLHIEENGATIMLRGLFVGRTRYTVRVAPGLRDDFEQVLERDLELTFETGDGAPGLLVPGEETLILDPSGPRALSVFTLNNPQLDVTLYRVTPDDWPVYRDWYYDFEGWTYGAWHEGEPMPPPFQREPDHVITLDIESAPDTFGRVLVDLRPALDGDFGHVVAIVAPSDRGSEEDSWRNRPYTRWVQSTNLGLDVIRSADSLLGFVSDLRDGAPIDGARVSDSLGLAEPATTDGDGLSRTRLTVDGEGRDGYVLAELGTDSTLVPHAFWQIGSDEYSLRWFVFDDRGIYRPGETVAVKGYVRRLGLGVGGDVEAVSTGATDAVATDEDATDDEASEDKGAAGDDDDVAATDDDAANDETSEDEGAVGDDDGPETAGVSVTWTLRGWDGNEIAAGQTEIGAFGAFDIEIDLPVDAPVGHASLELRAPGAELGSASEEGHILDVNIAEFRRPEFEISADAEVPEIIVGESGFVSVQATYFAGGALPGAEVQWWVRPEPSDWRPAGWEDFVFGRWRPWWLFWDEPSDVDTPGHELTSRTDSEGRHRLAIDLSAISPPSAMSLVAQATVYDVNRQASSASTAVIAHPAALYVGVRSVDRVVEPGRPARVEAIVTDLEGEAVPDRIVEVVAERIEHQEIMGEWQMIREVVDTCQITSAMEPEGCSLTLGEGGQYRLRASVVDDAGRANESELTVWMPGQPAQPRPSNLEEEQVELIPNKDEYAVGETASVLVRAPFAPAEAVVTLRRSGLVETRRLRLEEGTGTVEVEIEEAHIPNLYVDVQVVGAAPRAVGFDEPTGESEGAGPVEPRPAFARGTLELRIPPLVRTLGVDVRPESPELRPGVETTVAVTVTDAAGGPLADSEIALIVADESVLALTDYRIPDPIEALYTSRGPDVDDTRSRRYVQLAAIEDFFGAAAEGEGSDDLESMDSRLPAGAVPAMLAKDQAEFATEMMSMGQANGRGGGGGNAEIATVAERTDLNPLAAFVPSMVTDAEGRASATFTLPDNVTRYRITAVATDGAKRFGSGEADVTARLPLTVRPSAPRFLNFGDAFELPIVVQNLSGADQEVDVVVRASNLSLRDAVQPSDAGGLPVVAARISVPSGDRLEVRFPAVAAMPGTAAFQAAAFVVGDPSIADAQRVTLPVYTPATTEAFATYGSIADGAITQPVLRPQNVVPGFGGLEITTSSTALAELTDAFLYLESYPFECAEQVASRLIAIVSMRDVLTAFDVPELQDEAAIDAAVAEAIDKLWSMQREDGGFGWWRGGWEPSSPWVTLHATHALVRAREKGASVDADRLDRALGYLVDIRPHLDEQRYGWSEVAKRAAEAHALSIRRVAGGGGADQGLSARAVQLLEEGDDDESVETLGWLLQVLAGDPEPDSAEAAAEIAQRIGNRVTETASAATIATTYSEEEGSLILSSDQRANAIVLDAWMSHAPESDLVPKLVRGLLDGRVRGRWSTTQENSFSLIALDRYFRTYEADEPNFTARAWLDDTFAGEATFQGRSGDRSEITVPLDVLPEEGPADLLLSKEGPGRLYYRLGLRYAPDDLSLPADERGFSVLREYEPVDDPADVRRTADGGWAIRAGTRVRVKLRLVAPSQRYHVALVDPLPAGLEALNPELATTEDVPAPEVEMGFDSAVESRGGADIAMSSWWAGPWYEHEAFRDHQVEVFTGRLSAGIHRYDYVARATTRGTFIVPPAKAEEMYHPEIFGRSGTERVVIE